MVLTVCLSIICLVILPDTALAWGGGIHLQAGLNILASLESLPPALAALLTVHPRDYLYGCIAADITLGKKYTHYLLNCHRWGVGRKLLQSAATDGERACAWGYLSHLAADVIAHNYYVPCKIVRSFPTVTMKHTYWEMRFETFADPSVWERAREICRSDQERNDLLLRRVLTTTIFSFGTNKRIFNSILVLSRLEKWQRMMQTLSENSRYTLAGSDRDEYLQLTLDAVSDLLRNGEESPIWNADPTGERALAAADRLRKNLRLLYRSGRLSRQEGMEQAEAVKVMLREALQRPELLRQLHNG